MEDLFGHDMQVKFSIVVGALFAVSEALALIPAVKANSVFELVTGVIKSVFEKFKA